MKRVTVALVVAGMLAACSESSMGPDSATSRTSAIENPTLVAQSAAITGTDVLSLLPVDDALERVVAVLPDSPRRQSVVAALEDLRAAVEMANGCAIRTTRMSAERALRDFGKALSDEHDADLDAIGLAVESVEQTGKGKC